MVNLDELRKKYEKVKSGNTGNADFLSKFFMMESGVSVVRILPGAEDSSFYAESAIHRITTDGNSKNYHCPRVKGDACPLCDAYFKLWERVNAMGKETPEAQPLIDIARTIKARDRYYLNVVDRRDSSVKILSVGQRLFTKILDCFFDEDYGDLTDVEAGWDFKINKDTQGQWPNYDKSAPKPKSSSAGTTSEVATWMDELHDIHGLVKYAEYEDLKTVAQEITGVVDYISTNARDTGSDDSTGSDDDYMKQLKNIDIN